LADGRVEAGCLVSEAIEDGGDVIASGLPGGPAIMAVEVWPDELDDAFGALRAWLSTRDFRPAGPSWEYLPEAPLPGAEPAIVGVVVPYRWR
jgi:hypothetical protein